MDAALLVGEAGVVACTILGVAVHEAGHALAGHWAGLPPRLVQIGSGPALGRWEVRRLTVALHALPLSGFTVVLQQPAARRRAYAAMIVGGPVANAVLAGLAAAAMALMPDWQDAVTPLFITQTLLAAVNLVPFSVRTGGRVRRSDGMHLLRLFRGAGRSQFALSMQAAAAPLLPPGEDLPPPSPDAPELLFQWMRPDRLQSRWARTDMQECVAGLLERERLTVPERMVALHLLLTNELSFGDTGSSDGWMRHWSRALLLAAPDPERTPPAVLLTYAGALARLGEGVEAEAALQAVTHRLRRPGSIVSGHIYMAQAVALQGRRAEAADWLAQARTAATGPERRALSRQIGRAAHRPPLAAVDPVPDAAISAV